MKSMSGLGFAFLDLVGSRAEYVQCYTAIATIKAGRKGAVKLAESRLRPRPLSAGAMQIACQQLAKLQ